MAFKTPRLLQEAVVIVKVEVNSHHEILQVWLSSNLVRFVAQEFQQVAVKPTEFTAGRTKAELNASHTTILQ
jgi:hypothetical protein